MNESGGAVGEREGLRTALGEAINALEWCDTRYKQTLAGKPVLDVDELRAYVARTLTDGRAALSVNEGGPVARTEAEPHE